MKLVDDSLFNFLPENIKVDKLTKDEDELYTMAHSIVIGATNYASEVTGLDFEDFDEEREEAIHYVLDKMRPKKVFQIGFDIEEGPNVNPEERESLFNAINDVIDNFYDINGNAIYFKSIGTFNAKDVTDLYK